MIAPQIVASPPEVVHHLCIELTSHSLLRVLRVCVRDPDRMFLSLVEVAGNDHETW